MKRKDIISIIAFAVLCIAVYASILSNSFLPDDDCEMPELPRPSTYIVYEDGSNYAGLYADEQEQAYAFCTTVVVERSNHYYITAEERAEIERVVMAEAGGEPKLGQMAVAQCILNACYDAGIRPMEAIDEYGYTDSRKDPSDSVKEAVSAVFDDGDVAVDEDIMYFYAPARVSGDGHEARHEYVCTIGGHRFFKDKGVE